MFSSYIQNNINNAFFLLKMQKQNLYAQSAY